MHHLTYRPEAGDIRNPERGFFHEVDFYGEIPSFQAMGDTNSLVRLIVRLDAYRYGEVAAFFLAALNTTFQQAREAGVKLIVRFAYNEGPYPNPEPDAPLASVLGHIEQLAPVLEANKFVIAWFEAGFIGAWGEWHSSTFGLDTPENKLLIRDALLLNFPQDRFVLFRYPGDIIAWFPQPLTETGAFSLLPQARVGHHNDCFLASTDDEGTYLDHQGQNHIGEWQVYLGAMTRFVPMAGETCAPNPPRSDCATALSEMALLHWTALNEDWHPEVIAGFQSQGCYGPIRERLGYRLVLENGQWSNPSLPGADVHLRLTLKNEGFAAPLLPRQPYLVLVGEGRRLVWPLPVDPRRWEPGQHTFSASLPLPQDLPPATYQLGVWLPDPSPELREDSRYAVRLANEGVWDSRTGINFFGDVTIAGGH